MFRTSSCPSSGATTTAVAASGLPLELGDSNAVGRKKLLISLRLAQREKMLTNFYEISTLGTGSAP
jgi:hypothetical protein